MLQFIDRRPLAAFAAYREALPYVAGYFQTPTVYRDQCQRARDTVQNVLGCAQALLEQETNEHRRYQLCYLIGVADELIPLIIEYKRLGQVPSVHQREVWMQIKQRFAALQNTYNRLL